MKLYRAFATVGGLTLVSRVLGFVRDILIAAGLGSGWIADAFLVAFRFPNLFRRLFGEGAFNAAFVPLFAKRIEGEGPDRARGFAEEALAGLAFVVLALSILAIVAMPWLMYLLAPGFAEAPRKFDLAVTLSQIAFPYLLCMSLVALLSGVLNGLGRFTVAAAAPILLNIVLIGALALIMGLGIANTPEAGLILAVGVTIAGIVQLAALWVAARRAGMRLRLRAPAYSADMQHLVALGVPGLVSGGVTQINIVVGTIIASLQAGAVSYLYYADRLYQLPLGIVGVAVGVVLLPELSRNLRAGDRAAAMASQNRSLEFALLLTIPAAVALFVAAEPIVRVLFERGAFTAADTPATASALAAFAAGLPAFVLIKVLQPAFFAREDTRTPMRLAMVNLLVNAVGSALLFFAFQRAGLQGHVGIAIATTLAGWINAAMLWRALEARGELALDRRLGWTVPMIVVASLAMGVVLWLAGAWLAPHLAASMPSLVKAAALAALVGAGALVYATLIVATGVVRPGQIRQLVKRG